MVVRETRCCAVELLGLALGTALAKGPIEADWRFWLELTGVGGGGVRALGVEVCRFGGSGFRM